MAKSAAATPSGSGGSGGPGSPSPAQVAQQARARTPIEVTGAQSLVLSLEAMDVDTVFGIPGGAILPAYDPLLDSVKVRHILVRHEQGAGHAAEGYAAATGRVGVCMATSGPGATNLVTPLADAHMDSVPIVAITGQVNSAAIGTDAFQEADIRGITMPITKHNYLVTNADEIPRIIAEAFHIASTGRPGPVLVDISKDALQARTTFSWPPRIDLPGYRPVTRPHGKQIREAARLIAAAERPILYVGGGVIRAEASEELRRFVELSKIPVVTTLMARGALPDSHPLHLGMPGMHGSVSAVTGLQKSDLIIALGARFDDRVTGQLSTFAPFAKVIHADIDPAEIGKNRRADVPIVGDCKAVITDLTEAVDSDIDAGRGGDYSEWRERVAGWKESFPVGYTEPEEASLAPQYVIERLSAIVGPEAVYVAGVGQHQMWAAQFVQYERPNAWLNSGGLGTMGYAVPAAMGAQVGEPDRTVWAIDGDGCFQMTNQELATCVINNIPIKVAVINNSSLGMVRQWQTLFYNERYSNTDLHTSVGSRVPDFVKLADAYGCAGFRCERPEDVDDTIRAAMAVNDRPVIVDFVVHRDAMVWPMVAAGVSNDLIQVARDTAPQWDREESEALEQDLDADHDGVPSGSPRN
ncbi:MAG TPA: acetolactate synthase large subunit [Ornithinibacter sp.]|jgi:acetolactate synthase-1/2/3 large subunit|uniref:Acetolactate synthase n=1 Tax=Ornithinibacter aureus TaxID=622664 RepID=A0ABP8JTW2_9MICO|nr:MULTISPECIES: acetolactate synthase large subunit [Ornithinibacter]MBP6525465.1 acetolactate synthase large subunit [Dermatophilaceae bacterium]KAF0833393.1 acetolactate synthase large subunit [Ornithinibacter aureus]HNV41722.1 acetolactate synthase large subunit [Ornithinibacter sp.]HOB81191.1 acetolactate synthase large subunit [Ornithinibacter sp.]HOT57880.1 acetolactate synthase large subunit [Ornithinibacter sp.]